MSSLLLGSPIRHPHSEALALSQKAPQYLEKHSNIRSSIVIPLVSTTESSEIWTSYENLLLSCLRTGDDKSAHLCLERLIERFGSTNEHVMGLRGLYQEAVAIDDKALESILQEYQTILADDPTNMPVAKRQIALLRCLSRPVEAATALTEMLDTSPTDIEGWVELSDLYLSQGQFSQALFYLEEVLLMAPNAWNIHARLAEVLYMSLQGSSNGSEINTEKILTEATRRYCRSIELCDDYLRGYYGLKLTTDRLLKTFNATSRDESVITTGSNDKNRSRITPEMVKELNKRAVSRLANIVRRKTAGDTSCNGYDEAEIISAKSLLGKSPSP